ncbi:MAG: hypothetical protein JWN65_1578 [Solirubrobacterales bacterium]|nr:hypothetical protein [Solirubrobacterales bacterium]
MFRPRIPVLAAAAAATVVAGGCGSGDKPAPTVKAAAPPASAPTAPVDTSYDPKIDPSTFTSRITHRYWPLVAGRTWTYAGMKDGVPERVEVRVSRQAKRVLGVPCVVVSDVVTSNNTLVEKTTDWYAQDAKGAIWYFGEDTKEYVNGVVTSTQGTWEAGVDNAKPGIVLPARPRPGAFYRQEYRPGLAEDKARILSVADTQTVPAGTYRHVVRTYDIDPLNPDKKEHKWYAPGVGPVHVVRIGSAHHEEIKLLSVHG